MFIIKSILSHIWTVQKLFNSNFINFDSLSNEEKQNKTKEYVLHLVSEASSLLDSINWKMHHKKDQVEVNRSDILLEWIDVFKYWLSIGLVWGFTTDEFVNAFEEKSKLVEQRYLQEFSDYSDKEIVVCDIDGVLSDYPETFLDFVEMEMASDTCRKVTFDRNFKSLNLYTELAKQGVDSGKLKEYKHLYRVSGESRRESVIKGAKEFLKTLRDRGYYVVLLTSRPFDKYKNLYLDTYTWLINNQLEFDMLLSDNKKRDKIMSLAKKSSIKFLVDDDPRIISGLLGVDCISKIYLMDKKYNQEFDGGSGVVRVAGFEDILKKEELC